MGHDENFCESNVNVISLFTICVKSDIRECQFQRESGVTGIQFNWSESWFYEMLKIAFEGEFSVNLYPLIYH